MRRKLLGLLWLGMVLALVAGCSGSSKNDSAKKDDGTKKDDAKKDDDKKDEGEAPHGGKLFAPGTKQHPYHLELTQEKGKPTYLYVWDSKVKKPVPITAKTIEMEIKGEKAKIEFKADRQEGDPEGESSRFKAAEGKVPDKLDLSKVEIHAKIKGKDYHFVEDKD